LNSYAVFPQNAHVSNEEAFLPSSTKQHQKFYLWLELQSLVIPMFFFTDALTRSKPFIASSVMAPSWLHQDPAPLDPEEAS
jgi:hypothetical protein